MYNTLGEGVFFGAWRRRYYYTARRLRMCNDFLWARAVLLLFIIVPASAGLLYALFDIQQCTILPGVKYKHPCCLPRHTCGVAPLYLNIFIEHTYIKIPINRKRQVNLTHT
jgi:hypothetical protein